MRLGMRDIKGEVKMYTEIVLGRLGLKYELASYDTLIKYIHNNGIHKLEGDVLEIGAFMGGGTRKLAQFFQELNKKIIVIDIFDPCFDKTRTYRNESLSWFYKKILGKRELRKVFNERVHREGNVIVYDDDSKRVKLPENVKLCFSFIDGNHNPNYVRSDFELAWKYTVPGGVVAFHDFDAYLPDITKAIEQIMRENVKEIGEISVFKKEKIIFLHKYRLGVS